MTHFSRLAPLVLILLMADAAGASHPNLLANGDFDSGLSGWTVDGVGGAVWASADALGSPQSGSVKISVGAGQEQNLLGPCIPLPLGESLVFEGALLADQSGAEQALGLSVYSDVACTQGVSNTARRADPTKSLWQSVGVVSWEGAPDLVAARPRLTLRAGASGSAVGYFDRLRIRAGRCAPGPTNLCLNHGRFLVTALWETADGSVGEGVAVPFGDESGSFWFFASSNLELDVKVLNGCALNQRYWVFAAGLTNVSVVFVVIDTETGESFTYDNPQGKTFPTITDTQAFATCP